MRCVCQGGREACQGGRVGAPGRERGSLPVKVTKQYPEVADHSLTLASPPAVAMTTPEGEYASALKSKVEILGMDMIASVVPF